MKIFKRLLIFASVLLLYFIGKEFIVLFNLFYGIHAFFAYGFILLSALFIIYFAVIPIYKIVRIPVTLGPTKDQSKIDELRAIRITAFQNNQYLIDSGFNITNLKNTEFTYNEIIDELSKECSAIRKKYVNSLFYSSSVSQNGFLDAILILSTSVNIIKEIFILYNGRVSNRDLLVIAKKVYYSIAIGGSEGVEYASEEIFSKLATDTLKSIPFLDKIFSSLADGFINATLLTRASIITENYCKMLYIETDKDLYPSIQSITSTAKNLTSGALKSINENLIKLSKEKSEVIFHKAYNPVKLVFERSIENLKDPKQNIVNSSLFNVIGKKLKNLKEKN